MTKYVDIADELREQIKAGIYAPGSALPDQKTLAAHYQTSRVTVQKALQLLKTEDFVYSHQGAATYVKYNAESLAQMDIGVDEYLGATQLMGQHHQVSSSVIRFDLRYPTEIEQAKLALTATQAIYDIVRLRNVDGRPYALEYTKMPVDLIPDLDQHVLAHSIYQYIEQRLGLTIGAAYRQIKAQKATAEDQRYLKSQVAAPIFAVTNVVYLADGRPFEYSTTHQPYDIGHFSVYIPNRRQ